MSVDVWKRMTVGCAVLVIVTLALTAVHGVLTFVQAYAATPDPATAAVAVRVVAYPTWLAVTLVAVMLAAVLWAGSGRALTVVALLVAAVSLLVLLGFGAFRVAALLGKSGTLSAVTELVALIASMILPVASIVVLVRLLPVPQAAAATPALPAVPAGPAVPALQPEPGAGAPVWKPDQASGAHWQTAGAAAAGAAAQNWGRPGERGGWGVQPGERGSWGAQPGERGSWGVQPGERGGWGVQPGESAAALPAGAPGTPGSTTASEAALATPAGVPPATSAGVPPATSAGVPPATSAGVPPATSAGVPPVHQPRPPEAFGPQALAQRYSPAAAGSAPDPTPAARREPPRWTPLDRPSEQGPPQG